MQYLARPSSRTVGEPRLTRWHYTFGIVAVFVVLGCQGSATDLAGEDIPACVEPFESKQYQIAFDTCSAMYQEHPSDEIALIAGKSAYHLGLSSELLQWHQRLQGPESEVGLLPMVGYTLYQQGEFDGAREAYARERDLHAELGAPSRAAASAYQLFQLAWERSDFGAALQALDETRNFAESANDDRYLRLAEQGSFTLYFEIGNLDAAEDALNRMEPRVDSPLEGARLASNRGLIQEHRNRPQLAIAFFEQALEQLSEGAEQEANNEASEQPTTAEINLARGVHLNIVDNKVEVGDLPAAHRHLLRAQSLVAEGQPYPYGLLFFKAKVEAAEGRHELALESLASALDLDPPLDWRWEMELAQGRSLAALGKQGAKASFEASVATLETLRGQLGAGFDRADMKVHLLAKRRLPYEELLQIAVEAGDAKEAWHWFERMKARSFLEAMLVSRAELAGRSLEGELVDVSAGGWLSALSEDSQPTEPDLAEKLEAVSGASVVGFLETSSGIVRLSLVDGQASAETVGDADELFAAVDRLQANLDDEESASVLGALIAEELWNAPSQVLYLVTDGQLGSLPLAVLRRDGRFLVEHHDLVYIPNLAVLARLSNRQGEQGEQGEQGGQPERAASIVADSKGDLPDAAVEANLIARGLDAQGCCELSVSVGSRATSAGLLEAPGVNWLHLAVHTGIDAGGPWIQLADRKVRTSDLLAWKSVPNVAVLASCSSGQRVGNELWGSPAAAFLLAGSHTVVGTLKPVDDRVARSFVESYYGAGAIAAPALSVSETQRRLLRRGVPPRDWSSFVALGTTSVSSDATTSTKIR